MAPAPARRVEGDPDLLLAIAAGILLAGCGIVRPSDIDTWVGMPIEALDTHSFFITLPMTKRVTAGGLEVRNYDNTRVIQDCDDMAYAAPVRGGAVLTQQFLLRSSC